jgi:hypothetical protein
VLAIHVWKRAIRFFTGFSSFGLFSCCDAEPLLQCLHHIARKYQAWSRSSAEGWKPTIQSIVAALLLLIPLQVAQQDVDILKDAGNYLSRRDINRRSRSPIDSLTSPSRVDLAAPSPDVLNRMKNAVAYPIRP